MRTTDSRNDEPYPGGHIVPIGVNVSSKEGLAIGQDIVPTDLLRSAMFPVRNSEGDRKTVALEDILCSEERYRISHPRDDYEFAFEELAIALTQVVFTPKSDRDIRARVRTPMTREEFRSGVENFEFRNAFCIDDEKHPFMQTLSKEDVETYEPFEIRSLVAGLPGDTSSTLFNAPDEIKAICPSCAAATLFNMGHFPLGGAGYMSGIRGEAPLTVLVNNHGEKDLRKSIWMNILSDEHSLVSALEDNENAPVWVKPFRTGERGQVVTYDVGLVRGLFWQPIRIRLHWKMEHGICDCCGQACDMVADRYLKRPGGFVHGETRWTHPYTPYALSSKTAKLYPVQAKSDIPTWSLLGDVFPPSGGHWPLNVSNYAQVFGDSSEHISLFIGGYQNKKAKILGRKFEQHSLATGWSKNVANIVEIAGAGRSAEKLLWKGVQYFAKEAGFDKILLNGFLNRSRRMFYQCTEDAIRRCIIESLGKQPDDFLPSLGKELLTISRNILGEIAKPYQNRTTTWFAVALSEKYLSNLFTPKPTSSKTDDKTPESGTRHSGKKRGS